MMSKPRIAITDGAYVVEGDIPLYLDVVAESANGSHLEFRRIREIRTGKGSYLLCRCGKSLDKLFCDAMHHHEEMFDGGAIFHDGSVPSMEDVRAGSESAGELDTSFKDAPNRL